MVQATALRILFVEDLPSDEELAKREIRKSGLTFDSMRVETKEAYIRALVEFRPDVVVSDYMMPSFDGMQALTLSLEQDPWRPFIVLTGSTNEETAAACIKAGATDYVIKEHIKRLPFAVKEALEQRNARLEKEEVAKSLRESRSSLRAILDSTADGIFAVNSDNKVLFANEQFAAMWNLPPELLADQGADGIFQYALGQLVDPDEFVRRIQELRRSKEKSFDSLAFRDGRVFERFSRPLMEEGEARGRVWSFRDITERIRAEVHIRYQASLLGNVSDAVLATDREFNIQYWNAAAEKQYGWTSGEVLGKHFTNFIRPQYMGDSRKHVMRQIMTTGSWKGELSHNRRDGTNFPVQVTISEVRNPQGLLIGHVAVNRDITEQKHSEERIRSSEAYYRTLTEAAPDALVIVDMKGAVVFTSQKAIDMFEIPSEQVAQVVGTNLMNWVAPEGSEDALALVRDILEGRTTAGLREARLLKHDQTQFWADINSSPIADESGNVVGLLLVCRDITERKSAEQAVRESEERYRTLIAHSPDAIYVHVNGCVTMVNPEVCRLLRANDASQLLGKAVFEIVHPDYHDKVRERWSVLSEGQPAPPLEEVFVRLDGTFVDVEVHAVAIDWQGSKGVQVIARDITERKLTEEWSNQAAEALRTSEARYRAVLQSANDAIVTADSDGNITGWNKGAEKIFGYSYEEIVGYSLTRLMPENFRLEHTRGIHRLSSGTDPHILGRTIEVGGVDRCGRQFPLELSLAAWQVTEGQFYTAIIRDITDRKSAETTVQQSELRFRSVWNSSADGMRLTDRDGRILDVNDAYCRLVGMTREHLLGQVFSISYIREGPDDDLRLYQKRFDENETIASLFGTARLTDGKKVDLEITSSFMQITGEEKMLLCLFRDVTERTNAEQRIQDERNLLRTIIDAIPDEIFVKDRERRFIVVNDGTMKALGCTPQENIIGKKDEDLTPGQVARQSISEENAVLAVGGHARDRVTDIVDPATGEIERSLLISKIPLKDKEGNIIGVVGINRDITALKRIEDMLQRERTLLHTLIENIPDEICLKDVRHRYLVANRASLGALGVTSLEDLVGKTDEAFAPPEMAEQHVGEEDAIVASGQPMINREQTIIDPDTGAIVKCALVTKVPIKDQSGKTIGILVVNRDITGRKRAEESLRASEEKYRTLFEESKDCIFISTVGGTLLDVNAAGVDMFGFASKEEVLRLDLGTDIYVDPHDRQEFLSRINQQGFVMDYEASFKRKDGQKLSVLETATAVRDAQGKIVRIRGTIRDVTNQKQLERQIGQAQKMESLGLLAGGIAHDFNNILGIILGHTAVVERAGNDPVILNNSIGEITTAVQRGASLVRQILTFARKSEAADEPVSVNATVQELAKMIDDTFPKTISVSLKLDKTIPIIMMDQTQLHQAVLNLCVNARDAITDSTTGNLGRGEIRIMTSCVSNSEVRKKFSEATAPEYVCIAVSDSGKGMDEETKQKIFEPFFTTKERGKGTGLGLSVVYGIIKSHHGHIEVQSVIGMGATFRLYLPVTDAAAVPAVLCEENSPVDSRGTETILLVEDELNLLGLMKMALERSGYTVLTAVDGISAIKVFSLNRDKIALVLTDLGLPKLDGAAVFTSMMDIDPKVKIVLASGYLDPNLKSNLLRSGAKDFIQKPYDPNLVLRKIREVLDEKA